MRNFYDDDLECVFNHLCSVLNAAAVCKNWNNILKKYVTCYKIGYVKNLIEKLNKTVYCSHYWNINEKGFLETVYKHKSGGCIAFHHSNYKVLGNFGDTINIKTAELKAVPFISYLEQKDKLFENLKHDLLMAYGTSSNVMVSATWSNEFVTVNINGYSPIPIDENFEQEDVEFEYHINWEKCIITF
jgi:hypothetical protein